MPGMIPLDESPAYSQSPLQSFSSLSLSPLTSAISPQAPQHPWVTELRSEERGLLLIQLLLRCSNSVACGQMEYTNLCLEQLSLLASLTGDPMQRVATYFMEGLAARITKSWPGLYKALNCTNFRPESALVSARQVFFNLCPYLKFGFTVVNQCILDVMEGEKVVHIIDFGASEAIQWVALLQMLRTRAGGPPHLRITIINERKDLLEQMGRRLSEEAEKLDIPFQFHAVVAKLENLEAEMLRVKSGEAVAVSSVLQLHNLLSREDPPATQGSCSNWFGQAGSIPGGFYSHHGSPQTDADLGFFVRDGRSPNWVARNTYHRQFHDDRGMKRNREQEIIVTASREADIYRSMYGNSPHDQYLNGDRTLRELLEDEGRILNGKVIQPALVEQTDPRASPSSSEGSPLQFGGADKMLQMLRSLSPKIMVVMEQESNHNSSSLVERFEEALHYYSAMFDSLHSTLPEKLSKERLTLEKHLFGREIHNLVACEGLERVERHEKMDKWRKRLEWAGFSHAPLSYSTMIQAKNLLLSYSEGHMLVEDRGCLTVRWQETPLFSASAWR